MFIGRRRAKISRALLRPAPDESFKPERSQHERITAGVFALVAISVLVSAVIVHGAGPPFTYRIGQRPVRDLRVNIPEFKIRNQTKTANERQTAAELVPPVLINDPAPLRELAERLDDLAVTIAKAARMDDLRADAIASWRLTNENYLDLKAATDTPERRDNLHVQITAALAVLTRDGILGPGTLPPNEEASRLLSIRDLGQNPATSRLVPRDRVLPERIVKPDSPVHQEFCSVFTLPRVGEILLAKVALQLDKSPTLSYDAEATTRLRQEARNRVRDHYDTYTRGEVLVEQDQSITEEQLILLRLEHEAAVSALGPLDRVRRGLGILALVAALFGLTVFYVSRREQRFAREPQRVAMVCGLVIVALAVVRLLASQTWNPEFAPVAVAAMIVAIAYNPSFGMMITFALSLLACIALGKELAHFLVVMGGTAAGVLSLGEVRARTKLMQVGIITAAAYFLLTWATGCWQDQPWDQVRSDSLWRGGWGLMAGFFLSGSLPFIEKALGIVTGISLLELGDNTHPLLQELVRRAPGTYNHSITVGAIAESAAKQVRADALLVRIGAYFHDIGKMLKPHYFVENQVGPINRHAKLAPAMSTLIIVGHVKDGVDLGRQHRLPEPIIDLIEEHHGTTLVEYFYHEANRRFGNDPDAAPVLESAFRYPGPKPQTREAAILMVADAVESASRALSDPTPARLEGLVRDLIDKRLHDGQFDECSLTLREIAEIRDSLIKSLIGIYHGRVKYPEHRTA
jgi:putative nucleotidyltransferase with HDIG domain